MDVTDEKDAFVIIATLPGLSNDDIEIEIVNDIVDIRGEFAAADDEDIVYLRRERPVGSFRRHLKLNTKIDAGKADAKLENGNLILRLPKVEEELPKSIKVKTK
jgi:HSP20 family protein